MMHVTKQFLHIKIPLEAIVSATNNFSEDNCIGNGGFGKVYKGELIHSEGRQTVVAIKRLNRAYGQGDPEFWKEIIMLSQYKHENIVSLFGFCDESDPRVRVCIQRLKICIGAARGLAYLHNPGGTQQRVLHRDIKSSNILLDENWNARISDLGLSKFGPANQRITFLVSNAVGTIGYCDPVYVETGVLLTKESDVYSFGVVLFEVLCGRLCIGNNKDNHRPLTGLARECYEENKLHEIIYENIKDEIKPKSLKAFLTIAYQCLKRDLEERPLMTKVVRVLERALEHQGDANSQADSDSSDDEDVVESDISTLAGGTSRSYVMRLKYLVGFGPGGFRRHRCAISVAGGLEVYARLLLIGKRGRPHCCSNGDLKKGPWTPEEDERLCTYIQKYGYGCGWQAIPRVAGPILREEAIPFRYLGLPVGGNMNRAKLWQPLIEKFTTKLSTWKAKSLSIGGRCCLCKSVLGTLGTYMFSLYKAPKKTIKQLEGIRCKFLWGGSSDDRNICWMAWDKVIRDKKCGGLGIGSLRALNLALLMKWRWREKNEPNAIWTKVIRSCAGRTRSVSVPNRIRGTWKSILSVENDLREMGINMRTFLKPKRDGSGWEWELDSSKEYTVKSLRRLIDGVMLPTADNETEWIRWVPSKSNIHLWRVLSNRLPTRDNLIKRGVVLPTADCPFCHTGPECLNHVLTSCSMVKVINALMAKWVDWWPTNGGDNSQADVYKVIGVAFLSTIWKMRNNKVFKGEQKKDNDIVREIQMVAFNWVRCRSKFGKLLSWENWLCNPVIAVASCTALASR
ncbi:LOW QUALITY PROTEIN: hypothetical protein OSB04_030066 [Centaurea solstitialis]|uniref:Uncharacterized protein n=1 Tax=Centaurea solstitialis TaxID=347529 RepID=A0AA38SEE8_9ASTR|nr:LOW QUALITY PROTEIN: hypothetical protein OSB04_030066 [Centaurea solstitialis]